MTRFFDFLFSLIGLLFLCPLLSLLYILGHLDTGSPIFRQVRVGKGKKPFSLLKFRSMNLNAPSVATHLAKATYITSYGHFLRRSKLDELPQLWNVFVGEMSLVGPRPNLYSQIDLIVEREVRGVYTVRPGITGLAQINGIDMSTPVLLAETDEKMINELNIFRYFKYIFHTVFGKGFGDRIK
jgi:lipopolysaccharide/colanic/teichoic acid biosynthesis glycosyltransferase